MRFCIIKGLTQGPPLVHPSKKYDFKTYNVQENDDFKNAKIYKIYEELNNARDVIYIGSICDTLSKCMSKLRIKSKSRVNWSYDKIYMMIRSGYINCKIKLMEIFHVIMQMN